MKLQDHLHYTDFKNELLQRKHIISTVLQKKIVDAEEKANGNNVDSQEEKRQYSVVKTANKTSIHLFP